MKKEYNSLDISIVIMEVQDIITGSQTFEDKDVTGNDIYNNFEE